MNQKTLLLALLFAFGLSWFIARGGWSSGGGREVPQSPAWVDQPNGVYEQEGSLVLLAVGVAADNPNPAARRNQALARGRSELARLISELSKSCAAELTPEAPVREDVARSVTNELIIGSQQHRAWRDPADGTYYTLMSLRLESFLQGYEAEARATGLTDGLEAQLERLRARTAEEWNARR